MSYRPHNSGHDYYDKGIYLITLVVGNRDRLLGELNMDVRNPSVSLTPWSPETSAMSTASQRKPTTASSITSTGLRKKSAPSMAPPL